MVKRERETWSNPFLEIYANYILDHSKKIAKTINLKKHLNLDEKEMGAACSFLAERIAKANRYYRKGQVGFWKRASLRGLIETLANSRELTSQVCQFFENRNEKIINNEPLSGPRIQTLYQAVNDFSARVNCFNDSRQKNNDPLKSYFLSKTEFRRWQKYWQEKIEPDSKK